MLEPLTYTGINAMIIIGSAVVLRLWLENTFKKALAEWESKQTVLAERRAEATCHLYSLVARLRRAVREYTSQWQVIEKSKAEQKAELIARQFIELRDHFEDHELFFDQEIASSVQKLLSFALQSSGDFSLCVVRPDKDDELAKKRTENWVRIDKDVQMKGEALLADLRTKFRAIIGVE